MVGGSRADGFGRQVARRGALLLSDVIGRQVSRRSALLLPGMIGRQVPFGRAGLGGASILSRFAVTRQIPRVRAGLARIAILSRIAGAGQISIGLGRITARAFTGLKAFRFLVRRAFTLHGFDRHLIVTGRRRFDYFTCKLFAHVP